MDRPTRHKKAVDYSQFGDLDNDDEDFTFSSAPPSKKARLESKKEKKEKTLDKREKAVKRPHKEVTISPQASQGKRIPLDDKLYQRDLEVALALSVKKTSSNADSVKDEEDVPAYPEGETSNPDVSFSNCSVDSNALGLDLITNNKENQADGRSRREAASKAIKRQSKQLVDDEDEETEDKFKPAAYGGSESDSSFSGEDEDLEFMTSKNCKTNKVAMQKPKAEKNVPKQKTYESSIVSPVTIKIKSLPEKRTITSPPASANQVTQSPPAKALKPKWTPPASSGNLKNPLGGIAVKSPNQGLRLGLSRFARVKPLHPATVNH